MHEVSEFPHANLHEFQLDILPQPEKFGIEEARRWIDEDHGAYVSALQWDGRHHLDPSDRTAALLADARTMLREDLVRMTKAAALRLERGEAVEIGFYREHFYPLAGLIAVLTDASPDGQSAQDETAEGRALAALAREALAAAVHHAECQAAELERMREERMREDAGRMLYTVRGAVGPGEILFAGSERLTVGTTPVEIEVVRPWPTNAATRALLMSAEDDEVSILLNGELPIEGQREARERALRKLDRMGPEAVAAWASTPSKES